MSVVYTENAAAVLIGWWFWIGCRFHRVQFESNPAGKSDTYPRGRHPVFGGHSHLTSK
jgi:hypothetical protein